MAEWQLEAKTNFVEKPNINRSKEKEDPVKEVKRRREKRGTERGRRGKRRELEREEGVNYTKRKGRTFWGGVGVIPRGNSPGGRQD